MSFTKQIFGSVLGAILGGPIGAGVGFAAAGFLTGNEDATDTYQTSTECASCGNRFSAPGSAPWTCPICDKSFYSEIPLKGFNRTGPISPIAFSLFAIAGKIAKADGIVTSDEIQEAQQQMNNIFNVNDAERLACIEAFHAGKNNTANISECCDQLYNKLCVQDRNGAFHALIDIARADGVLDSNERSILEDIAARLSIPSDRVEDWLGEEESADTDYDQIVSDSYAALGLKPTATDQEVKIAHRKLSKEMHPDPLSSKGLPKTLIDLAIQRFNEVQEAYDVLKQERGM